MRLSPISLACFASVLPLRMWGCSAKPAPSETSAKGTLALSTFASAPTSVVVTGTKGGEHVATVDARGAFTIALPKGDRYALAVDVGGKRVPLVMPRRSGKVDATFKVSSRGVVIDLGSVRYLGAGAKPIFLTSVKPSATGNASSASCDPNGTGQYECVDDSEQSQCGDGEHGQQDNGGDGECQNGVDTKTKAPCVDPPGDDAAQADVSAEIAVPERSAPSDASGCEGDGESNDD